MGKEAPSFYGQTFRCLLRLFELQVLLLSRSLAFESVGADPMAKMSYSGVLRNPLLQGGMAALLRP